MVQPLVSQIRVSTSRSCNRLSWCDVGGGLAAESRKGVETSRHLNGTVTGGASWAGRSLARIAENTRWPELPNQFCPAKDSPALRRRPCLWFSGRSHDPESSSQATGLSPSTTQPSRRLESIHMMHGRARRRSLRDGSGSKQRGTRGMVIGEGRRAVHHTWSIHHCGRVRRVVVRSSGQSWCLVRGEWPLSFEGWVLLESKRRLSQGCTGRVVSRLDLPLALARGVPPQTHPVACGPCAA